jgi:SWI/SNF-related matrix-associated actin-dependent regulator of chromatin subfamily A3
MKDVIDRGPFLLERSRSIANRFLWSLPSIVFSSWKRTLDLVALLLSANDIPFAIIDGSVSLPERRNILADFRSSPSVTVLLMTLGTGAAG